MSSPLLISMLFSLGLGLLLPAAVLSAENDPKILEQQLQDLEVEISKFKQLLDKTNSQRSSLEDNLRTNEKAINELLKKIEQMQQAIQQGETTINTLRQEKSGLEAARLQQQNYLITQLRAAYEIGNQPYMKVLLNQEDPSQLDRMLTYYQYFSRARAEQIAHYRGTIEQLNQVTGNLEAENLGLQQNRALLVTQKQQLQLARVDKQQSLTELKLEIASTGSEIQKLSQNRQELEALLEKINSSVAGLPSPTDMVSFESRKGKMQLPVAGKILSRYGSQRSNAKLKWRGVLIEAKEGDPVYAIHYGRVIFSDWLRGFGLMMIISHGDGYMSLYGHNQVLYRETGDWIRAGENIASVGDSGGQNQAGLYFEIRHSGKPTNPQQWCQARSKNAA